MIEIIDPVDRAAIEAIRQARTVRIVINEGTDEEQEYTFSENRGDMTNFRHNLRLSVQDYVRACYDKGRMRKTRMGDRLQ